VIFFCACMLVSGCLLPRLYATVKVCVALAVSSLLLVQQCQPLKLDQGLCATRTPDNGCGENG
jgi:hypothetical protein